MGGNIGEARHGDPGNKRRQGLRGEMEQLVQNMQKIREDHEVVQERTKMRGVPTPVQTRKQDGRINGEMQQVQGSMAKAELLPVETPLEQGGEQRERTSQKSPG